MDEQEKGLLLAEVQSPDAHLVPNRFGILEPPRGTFTAQEPDSLDLYILPGLGFDRQGSRLGYGRGHYDRLLEGIPPSIQKIGIAFGFQIVPNIPQMPGDVLMDYIVTENGCISCQGERSL